MKSRTIIQAIIEVMKMVGQPMTVTEIYNSIIENNFYTFKSDEPIQIVRGQLRRHCESLNFGSASPTKYFVILSNQSYWLKNLPLEEVIQEAKPDIPNEVSFEELGVLHKKYVEDFRQRVLESLKSLDPRTFEIFSKRLLEAYGFHDVNVTKKGKDGGIDGYGKLKIGLADLKVSFQCKRWNKTSVGRKEIDQFRGAVQGKCEQAIFFTTSTFTRDAEKASFQVGAVPVILIDGSLIVDLMVEKRFGVEVQSMPIYISALDNVISENDNLDLDI